MAQVSKYRYLLNQYPETVQKEQFRIICHISKRTARYLLQSGLVPCVQSGKKTRNYTIKMKDIVRYLERREIHPEKYKLPPGSYSGTYAVKPLLPESVTTEELRKYYIESFRDIPDIVSTREAAELTGATASTVAKWIRTKKLKALSHGPAFIIPKVNLIDFIVKENLSDEDAWIYVIETNVLQRSFSEMLPSEKAAVLTLRYSKMICQGRRNDIVEELKRLENPDEIRENGTCGIECHKSKSRDVVGAEYDLKGRAVANYLRINELITPLKRRIDDAEFPIVVAVQLSYLTEQEQQMVDDVLSGSEYKVNEGKVVLLREYTGKLTPERTEQILSGEFNRKPKKSTATAFKVKPAIYKKYFTASISQKEFDSIVDEALALYFAQKGQESEQEAG